MGLLFDMACQDFPKSWKSGNDRELYVQCFPPGDPPRAGAHRQAVRGTVLLCFPVEDQVAICLEERVPICQPAAGRTLRSIRGRQTHGRRFAA
jgi:hypothetical protein